MSYAWLNDYCLLKSGATKEYKEDWKATRYLIGGKQFALTSHDGKGNSIVILKLDPPKGDFMRQTYEAIEPGYYHNKLHWNTIYGNSVPDELLKELLDDSYNIVFGSLTKKLQKEILGE